MTGIEIWDISIVPNVAQNSTDDKPVMTGLCRTVITASGIGLIRFQVWDICCRLYHTGRKCWGSCNTRSQGRTWTDGRESDIWGHPLVWQARTTDARLYRHCQESGLLHIVRGWRCFMDTIGGSPHKNVPQPPRQHTAYPLPQVQGITENKLKDHPFWHNFCYS